MTLSPTKFIQELKSQYPSSTVNAEIIKKLISEIGVSPDIIDEYINKKCDYTEYLLHRLRNDCDQSSFELFDEMIASESLVIAEINNPSPNAYTHEVSPLNFAIIFNTGLKDFIYRVARIISSCYRIEGKDISADQPSFEKACHILADIFSWFVETGQTYGPSYSVSEHQKLIASELAVAAEMFFLVHELGHVAIKIEKSMETNSMEKRSWLTLENEEFSADAFALYFLIERQKEDAPFEHLYFTYAGIEFGLQIFECLENLGIRFCGTHPTAKERIAHLRSYFEGDDVAIESFLSLGRMNEELFSRVIEYIKSDDFDISVEHEANSLIESLDALLINHSGGAVPDYYGFIVSVEKLFNRGYSHKLIQRFSQAADESIENITVTHNNEMSVDIRAAWVVFQKYKLLFSTVDSFPEPAKSIFGKSLQLSMT